MSSHLANNQAWHPPPHLRLGDHSNGAHHYDIHSSASSRPRTPVLMMDGSLGGDTANSLVDGDLGLDEDPRSKILKESLARSEAKIAALFGTGKLVDEEDEESAGDGVASPRQLEIQERDIPDSTPRKPARAIDEDDYDDLDDEDEATNAADVSPLKGKGAPLVNGIGGSKAADPKRPALISKPTTDSGRTAGSQEQAKSIEEVRKRLENDKKAAEDAAKRSFHTTFYTLENDRDAMLEQEKLDELDRQVEAEVSGHGTSGGQAGSTSGRGEQHSKLSNANLGASSLTLKHLIARIDAKRDQVRASDAELRNLMSEVRKNRSKWASEDKVGQEELYESAEKVLSELKAHTEHSTAFLTRVNKREARDYYDIIKKPMDLGTMTKKLKQLAYNSKKEFVDDLNLIWSNCLKYNADPTHFLRKHALAMRKETDKLIPLIPDIVVRNRVDVEAEERKMQNGDDLDGGEESDDEPIMSSRGRIAPGKSTKKGVTSSRPATGADSDGTPGPDVKPLLTGLGPSASSSNLKNDFLRADSDAPMDGGSINGLGTPPLGGPGTLTPAGPNGFMSVGAPGSQADAMDIDGPSINGLGGSGINGLGDDAALENLEYKTWKQVTKKDRARLAAERHRLFKGDKLNADEPALLRTKAGMRRWERQQRQAALELVTGEGKAEAAESRQEEAAKAGETLAEGMEEGEDERTLPDYYDPLSAIPEISDRLKWVEDSEGNVAHQSEEYLRIVEPGYFVAPESGLAKKINDNMRQMQETRKVCSKIGVIKQMQIQSQMYQNQFQKYNPEPFIEQDIEPHVVSDDGPIMSQWVCRAAMQRSVGKIFYHAGFEEFQPSALDAVTDIATDFFTKLVKTLGVYREAPKVPVSKAVAAANEVEVSSKWTNRFTNEETILHCLHENGLDVQSLESYVNDDVDRIGSKLGAMHERMKAHLADLLRPALGDAGGDGSNAFNDGSEQFVSGDFAEDFGEDFFGFRELGLDKEFGLASLGVPLHLLQNRMHNQYQAQNASATTSSAAILETPPPYPPLTLTSLKNHVGLVQNFFLAKLHANNDEPLVEDDDLPAKQRFPKPRLPPSGKITSPRKRPLKEQGGNKNKKRKTGPTEPGEGVLKMKGKLALATGAVQMERTESGRGSEGDKDEGSGVGMMSPESMEVT